MTRLEREKFIRLTASVILSRLKLCHPKKLTTADLRAALHSSEDILPGVVGMALDYLYARRQVLLVGTAPPLVLGPDDDAWRAVVAQ